ncbi:glucokinase [Arthrobacter pigmenti]|uniref:Glucokinase n=1 Tax=Arthrobacter pigmenti TaxID=271432 RepID=A0A846RTP3_9MICC|nr:ROK family protein [Arthrobacter pigmenti]NJC23884.1 glucokinase [Arthrobacter pigmenti]
MRYALGIDLGGTKTAAGLVDEEGRVLFVDQTPTLARDGAEAILDSTARLVLGLLRKADAEGMTLESVGIGSAGVIDSTRGVVVSATDSIAGWAGTRLTEGIAARIGLPCTAINDVHAHALGESWIGAAAGSRSALLVAVGTGVGGSFIVDGVAQQGAHFAAGHVGHFASPYAYDGGAPLPCTCGRSGHVEAIASGPAILQAYLRLAPVGASARNTREVGALAVAGDPIAGQAISTGAAAAGQAIGGLVNILDPEVVVVGGGMAGAGQLWWDAMSQAASPELLSPLAEVPIVPATLGAHAAVVGAARLALTNQPAKVAS